MENTNKTNTTDVSNETMVDKTAHAINPRLIMYPSFRSIMSIFIDKLLKDCTKGESYIDDDNKIHFSLSGREICGRTIHTRFEYMSLYYRAKYQHSDMSSDALITAYIEAICANVIKFYSEVGNNIYGIIDGSINPDDISLDSYRGIVDLVDAEIERITHIASDYFTEFYRNFYSNEE